MEGKVIALGRTPLSVYVHHFWAYTNSELTEQHHIVIHRILFARYANVKPSVHPLPKLFLGSRQLAWNFVPGMDVYGQMDLANYF